MIDAGIPMKTIEAWSVDPQVTYGAKSMPIKKSIFDTLEDTDSDYCLALCQMIASYAGEPVRKASGPQEKRLEELKEELAKYEAIASAVAAIQDFVPPDTAAKVEAKSRGRATKAEAVKSQGGGAKSRDDATSEERKLFAKKDEIRDLRKQLKRDGKTKKESDEAVAPLLEELKDLKRHVTTREDD